MVMQVLSWSVQVVDSSRLITETKNIDYVEKLTNIYSNKL